MGGSQQGKMFIGPGAAGERLQVHRGQDPGPERTGCAELRWYPEALETFMSCIETDGGNPGEGPPAIAFYHKPAPGMEQGMDGPVPICSVRAPSVPARPGCGASPEDESRTVFATG